MNPDEIDYLRKKFVVRVTYNNKGDYSRCICDRSIDYESCNGCSPRFTSSVYHPLPPSFKADQINDDGEFYNRSDSGIKLSDYYHISSVKIIKRNRNIKEMIIDCLDKENKIHD